MPFSLFLFWAFAGWCGTVPRRWWWPPQPDPDPQPWWVAKIIGVVAGLIGGWAYTKVFGPQTEPWATALPAAASGFGALLFAVFVTDIAGRFSAGPRA